MAGGHRQGDGFNQLSLPFALCIDDDGTLFIADTHNHRIVRWNTKQCEIVAGRKGKGNRPDQLNAPVAVLIDPINQKLIIGEEGNRRIMRWSLGQQRDGDWDGEIMISNIISLGLAMDDEGSLYASDIEKNEVYRYGRDDREQRVIVAGGYGKGGALNQLNDPRHIFVDGNRSIYVSDAGNHRVVRWLRGAREGVVVAGGHGQGNSLRQLHRPSGIFVDQMDSVYVADQGNHRVVRWRNGATEGEVLLGGNSRGSQNNQLYHPASISLDGRGNMYVVDRENHRVQCFELQ